MLVINGLIDQSASVFELFLSKHVFRRFFISGFRTLWRFNNNTDYFSYGISIIDSFYWHVFSSFLNDNLFFGQILESLSRVD